jgi:hypothetical protein
LAFLKLRIGIFFGFFVDFFGLFRINLGLNSSFNPLFLALQEGRTPLHYAAALQGTTSGLNQLFSVLVDGGADENVVDMVRTQLLKFVCLFAGRGCICGLYWHNFTSYNNNSVHTTNAPVRFGPESTRGPTATRHLSLPGLRYKTLLTTCRTSSPVEV